MTKALLPRWIFTFVKKETAPEPLPEDLSTLSAEDLDRIEAGLVERFDSLYDAENIDADSLSTLESLTSDIERVREEKNSRGAAEADIREKAAAAAARVRPPEAAEPVAPVTPEAVAATAKTETAAVTPTEPAEPAEPEGEPPPEALTIPVEARLAASGPRRINLPLSEVRRRAPEVMAARQAAQRPDRVIVAAADIPGFTSGGDLEDLGQVAEAMQRRARSMGDSRGAMTMVPIASIEKAHGFELDIANKSGGELEEIAWDTIQQAADPEILAAAGGWCAPSEIRYELFNVTCEDGMIDLPTLGINRGGVRWPVAITVADVAAALWTWTEANDIAADVVSGGPTKPCAHVECVSFSEARLAYEGLCVTAGNLTERSYPELVRNFLTTVMSAHFHRINKSKIDQLVSASTAVDVTSPATGAAANILAALDLQAIDYRAKFGMCLDDILEVVMPDWVEGPIRADFSRRMGLSPQEATISDAVMRNWFDERQVRVQFVNDYQIRTTGFPGNTTPAVAWPATVNFLIYAAGTFLLGDGPTIDLGVVRDSTLNAKNDYTAAWSEEGFLVAEVGHESRNVEVEIVPDGTTGDNVAITGPVA